MVRSTDIVTAFVVQWPGHSFTHDAEIGRQCRCKCLFFVCLFGFFFNNLEVTLLNFCKICQWPEKRKKSAPQRSPLSGFEPRILLPWSPEQGGYNMKVAILSLFIDSREFYASVLLTKILTLTEIWSGSSGSLLLSGQGIELGTGSPTSQSPVGSRSWMQSETPERTTHIFLSAPMKWSTHTFAKILLCI